MTPVVWNPPDINQVALPGLRQEPPAPSMAREVGQSFYLMGLVALTLTFYLGVGLLAVRLLG
jgi:hypothetical protein